MTTTTMHKTIAVFLGMIICLVAGLLHPDNSLAWPAKYTSCTSCHTASEPTASMSVALNGATATGITVTPGTSFEIDFIARNIAGAGAIGLEIALPTSWSLASGTSNAPSLTGWNTAWDIAAGKGWATANGYSTATEFPASPNGYTIDFTNTPWDSGNRNAAFDNGSVGDLDGTANQMGADAIISVPVGTPDGVYTIQVIGAGHNATATRGYVTQAITVTVSSGTNSPPTAANNTVSTNEDTDKVFAAAEFNFSDPDAGNTLNAVEITTLPAAGTVYNDLNLDGLISAGEALAALGTVSVANINAGFLKFKPAANASGSPYTTFTFKVQDNNAAWSASAYTMTINVTPVNDPPTITTTAPTAATEDTPYSYDANFTDADGTGENWSLGASNDCPGSSISALGVYTFTPAGPVPPASCVLNIQVCDNGGLCDTETATINITAVNDPPTGGADSYSTAKNTVLNVTAPGVLANDSDPEGLALTAQNATATDVAGSSVTLNANGSFTFTPKNNFTGADGFSYDVCDAGALCVTVRVNITVTVGGNNPPTFTGTPSLSATEDIQYSYTAAATDPESDPLTWSKLGTDTCGGSFAGNVYTFTPVGPTPPASCTLAIQVCDTAPACTQQTATITITAVNDAPAITSSAPINAVKAVPYSYTPIVSDPDGTGANWTVSGTDTCGGTFTTGTYSFTPAAAGTCAVAIQVCDNGGLCDTEGPTTITITDTAVLIGHNYDVNGGVTLNCNTCHAFHGGSWVPSDAEAYTACTQCHNSTSTYPTIAGNQSLWDVANHTVATNADPATIITVGCGKCHEVHKSGLLSNAAELEAGGGVARNLAYIRVNMAKYIPGAQTNTVFQQDPNHFAEYEATGVGIPLNGVCQSCHTDTTYHRNTDTVTDHKLTVGGPPNTTNCTGCHKHGTGSEATNATGGSFAASGGHSDTDFGWAGGCESCHGAGAAAEAVVSVIHGDKCDLCHTNPTGTTDATSEGPGPVANGVDGDASRANGDAGTWAATCTTCHDVSDPDVNATSLGGIHHDNFTDGVVSTDANCTTKCHNVNGHMGGHNTVGILDTTNCNTCHTATAGAADGSAPIASGDPKVHDGCMLSCHAIAATPGAGGILKSVIAPGGSVNISAGNCNTCHGAFFVNHSHHTLATNMIAADTNCATCHDATPGGTARNAISAPYIAAAEVHNTTAGGNGCAACHNTTTGARISLAGTANPATDGTATNYSCIDCHTTGWVTLHSPLSGTTIDHNTSLVTNTTPCSNCHNAGAAAGIKAISGPFNTAGEVHAAATTNTAGNCLTCHTGTNDGAIYTGASVPAKGAGLVAGGGSCATCHGTFETVHTHTHTGVTTAASCATATCHDATGSGGIARAAATTPFIGAGEVHATGTCNNCHDATTKALKVGSNGKGDATVNLGAGGDCIACHINVNAYTNWTGIHTAKAAGNHASHVTGAASCTTCHDAGGTTQARATSATPFMAAGDVHNTTAGGNGCAACHTGANDGGLKMPVNANQIISGDCLGCHTNTSTWTTIHQASDTVDHSQEVANLITCTASCHTATGNIGAPNIATLINAADHKIHDTCAACHNGDGSVKNLATADTHNPNWITAMSATGGTCGVCHDSAYFNSHVHGYDTIEYVNHDVIHNPTVDRSQAGGTANECRDCHNDNGGSLASWADIRVEHATVNGAAQVSCDICHNYATNGNQSGDVNTPPLADVNTALAGTGTTCITCHTPKITPATHGNPHGPSDTKVKTTAGCLTCHPSPTANPVSEVHADQCGLCHVNPAGGGALIAYLETNYPTGGTCAQCHFASATAAGHHTYLDNASGRTTGPAPGGYCIDCHRPDVGQGASTRTRTNLHITMPKNLACNFCHLWWPNNKGYYTTATDNGYSAAGAGGTIRIYRLNWDPNGTTRKAYATSSEIITHSISKNNVTPISDYAACFACHGASSASKGGGFRVQPFHGLGPAVTGFEPLSGASGNPNVLIELYAGANHTLNNQQNLPKSNNPYHPGFGAFNHVAVEVRPVTAAKEFATDDRKAHDLDLNQWLPATAITTIKSGEFSVPWDNYAAGAGAAPGTSATLNTGGQKGSFTKSTIMPLVPLNLPTSITP